MTSRQHYQTWQFLFQLKRFSNTRTEKKKTLKMYKQNLMLFMTVFIMNAYVAQESCERKEMEFKIKRHGCISVKVNIGYCSGFCMSGSSVASIPANYTRACIPIKSRIKKKKGQMLCIRNNRVFSQFVEYLDIKDCRCQDV